MKILHITTYYTPSFGYQENFLLHYQQTLGNHVKLIAADRFPPFKNYESIMKNYLGERIFGSKKYYDKGIEIICLKPAFELEKYFIVGFNKKEVIQEIINFNPDVIHIHAHNNPAVLQAIFYKKKYNKNVKLFVDCHNDISLKGIKGVKEKAIYNFFTKKIYKFFIYKHIEKYLPVTPDSANYLVKSLNIEHRKIVLLPLGSDSDIFFKNDAKRKEIRNMLGFQEDDVIIINTGKITKYKYKNNETMIKSFIEINKKYSKAKMLLVGSIDDEIKEYINILIEDRKSIIFENLKKNNELSGYYSAADIAIWTSPSNSIQDAMACELPIVIKNLENIKHLASNKNGYLCNNDDDFFDALSELVLDKEKRLYMGLCSRDLIINKYSWFKIAEESIRIYS